MDYNNNYVIIIELANGCHQPMQAANKPDDVCQTIFMAFNKTKLHR